MASDGAERKPGTLPDFAPVPWGVLRAGGRLSDGGVKAYALLCGLARIQNMRPEVPGNYRELEDVRPPDGGWGAALGCTDRTAQRWLAELIDAELVIRESEAKFLIIHSDGPLALIPLKLVGALSPALWRTLAVIQSRLNRFGRVAVSREILAADRRSPGCGFRERRWRSRSWPCWRRAACRWRSAAAACGGWATGAAPGGPALRWAGLLWRHRCSRAARPGGDRRLCGDIRPAAVGRLVVAGA